MFSHPTGEIASILIQAIMTTVSAFSLSLRSPLRNQCSTKDLNWLKQAKKNYDVARNVRCLESWAYWGAAFWLGRWRYDVIVNVRSVRRGAKAALERYLNICEIVAKTRTKQKSPKVISNRCRIKKQGFRYELNTYHHAIFGIVLEEFRSIFVPYCDFYVLRLKHRLTLTRKFH